MTQSDIQTLNQNFNQKTPLEILDFVINKHYINNIALVSSYGAEAVILLHLVSKVDNALPVIFIDTGKLFGETKSYREKLNQQFNLTNTQSFKANADAVTQADPKGILWTQDTDACCLVRKTQPYQAATTLYKALITGRKRFQGTSRTNLNIFEISNNQIKVNPLANWNLEQLKQYILKHDLPRHPLVADGYLSIGCMPCTDKITPDAQYRDGRWSGQKKTECGIHLL